MRMFKMGNAPGQQPLWQRPAHDLVENLKNKTLSPAEVMASYLGRIAERESLVKAWAYHDPVSALAQAARMASVKDELPMLGIPIGIKDIYDTADMPTAYGSSIYEGHRPSHDAEVVTRLRDAGAIIMGKTVTTEFAYAAPGKTVNPHDQRHTPGGSSSGSAAAVADGMVPISLGSQTGGSTIRPSAYCGIVGFKPSYGTLPVAGMKALSPSMDTIGIHARFVQDVAMVFGVLSGLPQSGKMTAASETRIGYFLGPHADQAEPDALCAMETARQLLMANGISVEPLTVPMDEFQMLSNANRIIMAYEAVVSLEKEYESQRSGMAGITVSLIRDGKSTTHSEYKNALALASRCREALSMTMRDTDILMTLSAPGEAPLLRDGTGNSVFNRAWTTMGVPCLTLPFGRGTKAGLPLGIQFVANRGQDDRLLAAGHCIEHLFKCSSKKACEP